MMGQEKVERATALVSQVTMATISWGLVVGTAVYGCFGIDALCETAALTFAMSAPAVPRGALKQNASSGMTGTVRLARHAEAIFGSRFGTCFKNASLLVVFLLCGYFEPCVSWVNDWCSRYCCKASPECSHPLLGLLRWLYGLGWFLSAVVWSVFGRIVFSFKGICRYVAMICFGVVPIIVTLLSGPDELAFAALAAGSAWVMAWASIASVGIVSFVQRSAPKELCGKVLALVYMTLSCATPIGPIGLRACI